MKASFKVVLGMAGLAAVGSWSLPVVAGPSPQTGSFNVTASVAASCRVSATTDVAFGAYDPSDVNFTTALDGSGSVSVRCVRGTVADVALDQGLFAGVGSTCLAPVRRMSDGGVERLGYSLFQDAARTTGWGCDASNDQSFTSASSAVATTLTVYGRVPPAQDVAAGSYSDTVTVTVTF